MQIHIKSKRSIKVCYFIFTTLYLFLCACDPQKNRQPSNAEKLAIGFNILDESAEAGGLDFSAKDWDTAPSSALIIGDKDVQKGGNFRMFISTFPLTIRFLGKNTNFTFNSTLRDLSHETLLKLHPNTLEYIPSLATHWQILRDYKTFRFRLNPAARWADGTSITTQDVIASWKLHTDEGIESPYVTKIFKKFKKPVAESKYIFHVTATELNWMLFQTFADMTIFPHHIVKDMDGKKYLAEYDDKPILGSGPYQIVEDQYQRGQQIVLERRKEYWGWSEKFNTGLYNFDRLEFLVEKDQKKAFERFQNGEVDIYPVNEAERWVKETNFPDIQRGIIQKRQLHNKSPQGFSGIAFNLRHPILGDLNIRRAMVLLFHRELMIQKFFFNQYTPIDSYFPSSVYSNPKNTLFRYQPEKAVELLNKAGCRKNKDGFLTKDGVILKFTLYCPASLIKRGIIVLYQEDLQKVGIQLQLQEYNAQEHAPLIRKYKFDMAWMNWGGSLFPDPEGMWGSSFADEEDGSNICGFKSERVNKICDAYNKMFLQNQRVKALQELDGVLMEQNPYVLGWVTDCHRFLYWNRFHFPRGQFTKTGRYLDALYIWAEDKQRTQKVESARKDPEITMPIDSLVQKYWEDQ